MKVSIALCTYNGQEFLEQQLQSLVQQTYPHLEIIVVDDHSTDKTIEILAAYQQQYPFIKYFQNEANLGYVKNFEKAISLCDGEYIALCDQDDIWDLDKINLQVSQIGDHALIYHNSSFVDESGNELPGRLSDVYTLYQGDKPHPFLFFNCVSGHSLLFHRKLIPDLLPFDERYFHDRWIAFIAAERGGIKLTEKNLVKYRQHLASSTDALKLKSEVESPDRFFNPLSLAWIVKCRDKTKYYKEYYTAILSCFDENHSINNKYKLFFLLLSKQNLLFFTIKKSKISRINYIRKICFRAKHSGASPS